MPGDHALAQEKHISKKTHPTWVLFNLKKTRKGVFKFFNF